jgi:lipid A 4'-phosphatase
MKKYWALWIPLLLLAVATIVFRTTDLDVAISRPFYVNNTTETDILKCNWPLRTAQPWYSLYLYGIYPAWIIGIGGLPVFLASFGLKKLQPYRDAGLFLFISFILGPGILVNAILKPSCSRPRPLQTVPFGGNLQFVPVCNIGDQPDSMSFPCGHASMGFFLMAPAFALYRTHRRWSIAFMAVGLAYGTLMGIGRIVAGGHFASDVIWAATLVYFTCLAVAAIFRFGKPQSPLPNS